MQHGQGLNTVGTGHANSKRRSIFPYPAPYLIPFFQDAQFACSTSPSPSRPAATTNLSGEQTPREVITHVRVETRTYARRFVACRIASCMS